MRFSILGSGSKGNSTVVEGPMGTILLDAGFTFKECEKRLSFMGKSTYEVKNIFVTHEHGDHIKAVPQFLKNVRCNLYCNQETFDNSKLTPTHFHRPMKTGSTVEVCGMSVTSFPAYHDTAEPVGYVVEAEGRRLGYCLDTGKISGLMLLLLKKCHAVIVDCNYDPDMLRTGDYPEFLKDRVISDLGHLSNNDVRDLVKELTCEKIILAHLSSKNNTVEVCTRVVGEGDNIYISPQTHPLPFMEV